MIGVAVLVWAVHATIRWRKFGRAVFEMDAVPAWLGASLEGGIVTFVDLSQARWLRATLRCLHRSTTERRGTTRTEVEPRWESELEIPPAHVGRDYRGSVVPVSFEIPSDLAETTVGDEDEDIVWRLNLTAGLPGIDYGVEFDVPVFRRRTGRS